MKDCDHPQIPALTVRQSGGVDRRMTDELGVALLQMMELAGRGLAALARDRVLDGVSRTKRVVVLADIGVPDAVYAALSVGVGPIFARQEVFRVG